MNELSHLDLFSGIGGFSIASGACGFKTVGFSEVDPYCCRVLGERWPEIPNIGDVRITSNFARFRGCTIITGGFPCQPFSQAGKRRGKEDDRHLWPAMRAVIEVVRPTWIIGENVFGFVDMELDQSITDLESLGYEVQPLIVPACAVGARHVRQRVWILAHSIGSANGGGVGHNAISGQWKAAMSKALGIPMTSLWNPEWVESLMGYEIGHTELKLSQTPSSPKSLSLSSAGSRKSKKSVQ